MRFALVLVVLAAVASAGPKKHEPGALVLLIDRSGSMQGPKLDAAKAGALAAIDALDRTDQVAIITFDTESQIFVALQPAANRSEIAKQLDKLKAGGGTNVYPALHDASEMLAFSKCKTKHVILISDGESPSDAIADLVQDMRTDHITVSTVGVAGADRSLLSMIADTGDGRFYMVDDLRALAKIFTKEVKEVFK